MIDIKKYRKIGNIIITISSITVVTGIFGKSYIPYVAVIVMFWVHIIILSFSENKK